MKSILVIEDNILLSDFIAEVLQEEGYNVQVAANGQEGLSRLHEVEPDLVITDLMMPKLSGEEVCQVMTAHPKYNDIPVVLMSSKDEAYLNIKCKYTAFLPKPFDLNNLLGLVVRLIGVTI